MNSRGDQQVASLGGLLAVLTGVAVCALVASRNAGRRPTPPIRRHVSVPATRTSAVALAGAARTLAACVACDSAVEHYRGAFHNKSMWLPLISAGLSVVANGSGMKAQGGRSRSRRVVNQLALLTGLVGSGFHVYNVTKRAGGLSWQNLFYAAPLGAPAGLSLSGLLGLAAERLRAMPVDQRAVDSDGTDAAERAGRALAVLASVGIGGTVAEVWLLHLRGAYHNPAMYLPVAIPPVAAISLAHAALGEQLPVLVAHRARRARRWLRLTTVLGWLGSAFHVFGVSRGMGGWRNWRQNLLGGPPVPAPPSFSALAAVGLTALRLMERRKHD
ncbi:MAG TPA: hypothetical protein VHZ99_10430 [Steroidobacteraceae bacterium]|jgi:hypothetical protein|nr:hypothetical protein [Steroidobacteraceae bacterium]